MEINPELKAKLERSDMFRYWLVCGYTKPTALSMTILQPIIENAEGNPRRTSFTPWNVKIYKDAMRNLGFVGEYICTANHLHEVAQKYLAIMP